MAASDLETKQRKVLVADGDPAVRSLACNALEGIGLEVRLADQGSAVLETLAAWTPDLVLLDAALPGVDELELLERLGPVYPSHADAARFTTPVLLLVEAGATEVVDRAYTLGAIGFSHKPLEAVELCQRVSYILRAHAELAELRHRDARMAFAEHIARLGSWEMDLETGQLIGSRTYSEIYHLPPGCASLDANQMAELVHPDDRERIIAVARECAGSGEGFTVHHRRPLPDGEERVLRLMGRILPDPRTGRPRAEGVVLDVTERRRAEERIRFLAYHDGLTGLGNQRLFRDRIERALEKARSEESHAGLLFIDLDHFKRVNDVLGHTGGDQLIREAAARIASVIRPRDAISRRAQAEDRARLSRLGGDEFTLLITDLVEADNARAVARRILGALEEPFRIDQRELVVGASVGIAIFPEDGEDSDTLVRNADAAMSHAKQLGRNTFQFYSSSMNADATERLQLENKLRHAIETEVLEVYYQPRADLASGRITGMEALCRWNDPELGRIPPDLFVGVAEEIGLAGKLGALVMRSACRQTRAWLDAGHELRVSVNVSPKELFEANLPFRIREILLRHDLEPTSLELEITETALIYHETAAARVLETLKEIGVSIALDDFGTGYSSLNHLKHFPVDVVKIDRSFVQGVGENEGDTAIARAIVSMATALGLRVVAEGVETDAQRSFLVALGCHEEQGYRISPPVAADAFEDLIADFPQR